jgi:hypothetical protein
VVETGGGGRWRHYSGELAARPGQQASVGPLLVLEEGKSSTCWRCKRPEGGTCREHRWRWQWRLGGSATRVTDGVDVFIAKLLVGEEGNLRTKAREGSTRRGMGSRTVTTCDRDWPMAGGGAAVQPVGMHHVA